MHSLNLLLLIAMIASLTPHLELSRGPKPPGPYPGFTITLTLVNDSAQSIDLPELEVIRPSILDAQGRPVILGDVRNAAGASIPRIPEPPGEPVRPGKRQVLARYVVIQIEAGRYSCRVPFGGGPLAPGRYRFSVRASLRAVTKAEWVARYQAGAYREKGEPAEQAAARYDVHWAEVASFWTGDLESNELAVEL